MVQKITYQRNGDYMFPNLMIEDDPVNYGKYGMLRKNFLKENKKNWYQSMMLSGRLDKYLTVIDQRANEEMEMIVLQMTKTESVTEQMKADEPMTWVAKMNNIRNRAEEIVLAELIYS